MEKCVETLSKGYCGHIMRYIKRTSMPLRISVFANSRTQRVVRHLLDKDDAVDEVVEEYERDGIKLIDALDQAHAHYRQEYRGKVNNARARIVKDFGEWGEILVGELKRIRESRVGKVEEEWKADVAKIRSHIDAALLAYGE